MAFDADAWRAAQTDSANHPADELPGYWPLSTDEMPQHRDWTPMEWQRNQRHMMGEVIEGLTMERDGLLNALRAEGATALQRAYAAAIAYIKTYHCSGENEEQDRAWEQIWEAWEALAVSVRSPASPDQETGP